MLQFLLEELKGDSVVADQLISASVVSTITCNTCFNSSSKEEKFNIIALPLSRSFSNSLNKFLEPELLKDENKWFCGICNSLQDSIQDCKFVNCGSVLIFQLKCYAMADGTFKKDNCLVKCLSESLKVPILTDNDVIVKRKFKLKATINHSGTLNAGHYWAFVKASDNSWLKCNDISVTKAAFKDLTNNSSYIFIYCAE